MLHKFICIALLCLPILSSAQSKAVIDFYDKYKTKGDVAKVDMNGWVLKLAAKIVDEEDTDQLLSRVTRLRALSFKNEKFVAQSDLNKLMKDVRKDKFEDLMHFKDDGDNIKILIREGKNSSITDILVLIQGTENFTLLSLEGQLKFKDIHKLNIDIEGAEYLEKVPEKRAHKPSPRA